MSTEVTVPPASRPATNLPPPPPRLTTLRQRFQGDLGQLPVILTLVVVAVYFEIATSGAFLQSRNLTELIGEIITIGTLALGASLILIVREIDLSLAAVSALGAAVMIVTSSRYGLPTFVVILSALLTGALVGAINGFFVSVVRIPAFIVTLAASIGYQGLLLHILLPQSTIPLRDPVLIELAQTYLPDWLGVGLAVAAVVIYALSVLRERTSRQAQGLPIASMRDLTVRIIVMAVVVLGVTALFESYRGVPLTATILIGLIVLFWLLLRRTRFGRHVYAIGGNDEAARRAGINVTMIRVGIFALASTLATVGGVLQSSRALSVSAAVDPTLILNALAAPIIGGVSLFGGRGSVWSVVIGALIVGSLINGLALSGQGTDVEQMVEGGVLLIAVIADALVRRRNATGVR